uniref:Uncharacterized protein n=1 Tax=Oryza barthii TaxID=65489 RepID=A0A0D3EKC7_9ORYZ
MRGVAQEVAHCGAWPAAKSWVATRGLTTAEVAKTTATAAAIDKLVCEPVVVADEPAAAANEPVVKGTVAANEPTVREGIVAPTRLVGPERGDDLERGAAHGREGMATGARPSNRSIQKEGVDGEN